MSDFRRSLRRDLYDGVAASGITSNVQDIRDAVELTIATRGSPSTTTIQLSNADGNASSIAETSWRNVASISAESVVDLNDIKRGARWMRALRSETTEVEANLVGTF